MQGKTRVCIKIGQNMTETFLEILVLLSKNNEKIRQKTARPGKIQSVFWRFLSLQREFQNFFCHSLSHFYTYLEGKIYVFVCTIFMWFICPNINFSQVLFFLKFHKNSAFFMHTLCMYSLKKYYYQCMTQLQILSKF